MPSSYTSSLTDILPILQTLTYVLSSDSSTPSLQHASTHIISFCGVYLIAYMKSM